MQLMPNRLGAYSDNSYDNYKIFNVKKFLN